MALRSMTGYGRGVATDKGLRVEVELNSLNRKQLDVQVSCPREFTALTHQVQELISRTISRGRVSGDIQLHWTSEARKKSIHIDEDLADAYILKLKAAAKKNGLDEHFPGEILLNLPNVVFFQPPVQKAADVWSVMEAALLSALKKLVAMRVREGRTLQKDLEARLKKLLVVAGEIEKRSRVALNQYRNKLVERLQEAGWEGDPSREDFRKELLLYADRTDITEEIIRLKSHCRQASQMMKSRESNGRALDFMAQEMFREINTIASKSSDIEITGHVVSFKTELERIREQLQNVE